MPWAIVTLEGKELAMGVPGTSPEDAVARALSSGRISAGQNVHAILQDDWNSAADPRAVRARVAEGVHSGVEELLAVSPLIRVPSANERDPKPHRVTFTVAPPFRFSHRAGTSRGTLAMSCAEDSLSRASRLSGGRRERGDREGKTPVLSAVEGASLPLTI
jgi:hypothetical protein